MKYLIIASICAYFMLGLASAEDDCVERAKKISVNMTECCKFPDFFEEKDIKDTYKKVVDGNLAQPTTPLFDCLVEQTMYQSMSLADKSGTIDKEACKKHIKEAIKDKNWEPIVQGAFTRCLTEGPKYGETYQKITGIAIETCDFKFDAISDCIDIASFGKCPKDSWTKKDETKEPCEFLKTFITDCYKDVSAVDEFLDHQKD